MTAPLPAAASSARRPCATAARAADERSTLAPPRATAASCDRSRPVPSSSMVRFVLAVAGLELDLGWNGRPGRRGEVRLLGELPAEELHEPARRHALHAGVVVLGFLVEPLALGRDPVLRSLELVL